MGYVAKDNSELIVVSDLLVFELSQVRNGPGVKWNQLSVAQ